jgi:hypothetical protein
MGAMLKGQLVGSRALGLAFTAAALVIGCVPYDPGAGAGGAGGGATTGTLEGTDLQVCGDACQTLVGCGAQLDQTGCKADCTDPSNAGLVSCFRGVAPSCDPLASCVWSALCSGVAPNGSQACAAGASCAVSCGGNPDPYCLCGCAGQVRPDQSGDFYVLITCLSVRCSIECGQSGDAVSCDDCLTGECSAAAAQCN